MSGDYRKMIADSNALHLATASALVDEGLSTFQQIIARAEHLKAARCSIYPALQSIGVEYRDPHITCDELVAVIRQFYGEMTPEEIEHLCNQHEPLRAALEAAIEQEDIEAQRAVMRERKRQQRNRQAARQLTAVQA